MSESMLKRKVSRPNSSSCSMAPVFTLPCSSACRAMSSDSKSRKRLWRVSVALSARSAAASVANPFTDVSR
jgi:hypothetical protein